MGNFLRWIKGLFKKEEKRSIEIFYSQQVIKEIMEESLFERFGETKELPRKEIKCQN